MFIERLTREDINKFIDLINKEFENLMNKGE